VENKRNIFKDNWRQYQSLGFVPYPASRKKKHPIVSWKNDSAQPTLEDYLEWEKKYPGANLWVLIGYGFAVIDPDGPGAEDFVKTLNLPECPTSISGNRSIHRWFKVANPVKPLKRRVEADGSYIELRTGTNQGMLVPPSIHPETQKVYRWMEGHSPWEIPFPELPIEIYEKIKMLSAESNPENQSVRELPELRPEPECNHHGPLDVERYLSHYGIPHRVRHDDCRTLYLLDHCLFAGEHTTKDASGDSAIVQGIDGKLGYQCFHSHCSSKTWADARKVVSGDDSIVRFCRDRISHSENKGRNLISLDEAILEADSFTRLVIPPKQKIINPWLTEQSMVLVFGTRGIGKTWFGLSLFDAITRGTSFGPWEVETPVASLYVDGEMTCFDMKERLNALSKSAQVSRVAPLFVYNEGYALSLGLPRANLLSQEWRDVLKRDLLERKIKLVALDNLSSLTPGIDENAKQDWDQINQWLLDLRHLGISVILFHHTNKEGDQRGTSAREDNLDTSILLQHPSDYALSQGARFVVKFKKTRAPVTDLNLMGDNEFTLTHVKGCVEWRWKRVMGGNRDEILRMIDQGISQKEISKTLGIDKGYVSRVKSEAIRKGFLTRTGGLTSKGTTAIHSGVSAA